MDSIERYKISAKSILLLCGSVITMNFHALLLKSISKERSTMSVNDKIKSLDELSDIIQALKRDGNTIVQCHGVFDLLHPGHILHFEAAKREGDILVVTVTRDEHVDKGPGRPVFNQRIRTESIASLQCVDFVALNEWPTAVETIKKLKPDVYVKGSEYAKADMTGRIYAEAEAVKSIGGRVHFTDEPTFSSSQLLNAYFHVYPEEADAFLKEFRRNYSSEKIKLEIGFVPNHTIEDAVSDLCDAFEAGKIPNSMTDLRYYNVKMMQAIKMT